MFPTLEVNLSMFKATAGHDQGVGGRGTAAPPNDGHGSQEIFHRTVDW